MSTEFLLTSLVVVLIPGTGVIYTISTGIFLGWRASIAAAIGCTLGITPHLTASILGLSAILHMSALAFQVIKFLGVAYLFYMAWMMWKDTGAIKLDSNDNEGAGKTTSFIKIATRGFLINILNPKLSIFFLAFLPLFVDTGAGAAAMQLTLLALVFMLMTLAVFIVYGLFAGGVRKYISQSPTLVKRMQRTFAATFALLGAKLAVTEQ